MQLVGDSVGAVHLIASILSLLFGTMVLLMTKGTPVHRRIGYAYVISMFVLIITSFMIYRLFNGFGVFHVASLVSLVTLLGGMLPLWVNKKSLNKVMHFNFMYWSVAGLYAALAAEVATRVVQVSFFGVVGLATFLIIGAAGVVFRRKKSQWSKFFKR